jgi:hypothetical protein
VTVSTPTVRNHALELALASDLSARKPSLSGRKAPRDARRASLPRRLPPGRRAGRLGTLHFHIGPPMIAVAPERPLGDTRARRPSFR